MGISRHQQNPKFAYYTVKRALALTSVGMRRIATKDPGYLIRSYETKKDAVRIWVVNYKHQFLQSFVESKSI